ncbi:MAG: hypothetical protein WCS31_02825 [Verrucomicrobiae bacterium]
MSPEEAVRAIHGALPGGGLFHEKDWRISPRPFGISPKLAGEIEKLGYRLLLFVRACDQLYRLSAKGRQPGWVAEILDRGKPPELVAWQREHGAAGDIPKVLRPDLILTDDGFMIAEVDSVPGGIGLTAWLNKTYAALGHDVLGGADGMLRGFKDILPGGDILVSEEAATYRPEMEWLAGELNAGFSGDGTWRVLDAVPRADWQPRAYRFFELFDLVNIPAAAPLMEAAAAGTLSVTPPFKPALEEKLWFALFWLKPLEEFWRRELGERAFLALQRVIPYTWLLDPEPLPRHAVLPRLDAHSWNDVAAFSQKKRKFILKISGFSERAWGSRGVLVASDIPQTEWKAELESALGDFSHRPHILQEFHPGRLVEEPFWTPGQAGLQTMRGRVRLCPYYFVGKNFVACGGALATICPDDKKLLHGMRDAILAPAGIAAGMA